MYLLLYTQSLDSEIGLMYPNYCLSVTTDPSLADAIQTDLKLKRGLNRWKHKFGISEPESWWDVTSGMDGILGVVKGLVLSFTSGSNINLWDDIYGAAMLGASKGLLSYDKSRNASLKGHVRSCCRNAIIDELRKIIRFNSNESVFSAMESESDIISSDDEDTMSFEDSIVSDIDTPEEAYLRKELVGLVLQKVNNIMYTLNNREAYILIHIFCSDDPKTYQELADEFGCSTSSIHRDVERIKSLLRE